MTPDVSRSVGRHSGVPKKDIQPSLGASDQVRRPNQGSRGDGRGGTWVRAAPRQEEQHSRRPAPSLAAPVRQPLTYALGHSLSRVTDIRDGGFGKTLDKRDSKSTARGYPCANHWGQSEHRTQIHPLSGQKTPVWPETLRTTEGVREGTRPGNKDL